MEQTTVSKRKKAKPEEKLTYEEAAAQLELVVRKLESGDGSLEEMIQLYEQGVALVNTCNERLDAYEKTIQKLSEVEESVHDDA